MTINFNYLDFRKETKRISHNPELKILESEPKAKK
jgi:hypothetical protein